jgi:hypothetical protein
MPRVSMPRSQPLPLAVCIPVIFALSVASWAVMAGIIIALSHL